jgi:hypothetical protein
MGSLLGKNTDPYPQLQAKIITKNPMMDEPFFTIQLKLADSFKTNLHQ